jgi:uncharacterized damage-inducible protein DinB
MRHCIADRRCNARHCVGLAHAMRHCFVGWEDAAMVWTVPFPDPVDGPLTGDDRPMLTGYLAWQRSTLVNICAGLSGEQLASRPLPSSNLSLLGLVRHAAKVERIWLRQRVAGQPVPPMYDAARGRDADFDDLDPAEAEAALQRLQDEWQAGDTAVAGRSFEDSLEVGDETWSLRMVYVHLIGEYARHNGHADLLREAIDGATAR